MKLTTLGGSAAGTGTLQGCSSYLVQGDEAPVVIDLGPGTLQQLRAHADYRALGGVVISHLHADHIADIVALRFTLSYNPVSPSRTIPLYVPPDGVAMLRRIAQAFDSPDSGLEWFAGVFDVHEYDPAGTVTVGDLTFTFTPTVHFVPCWAIRVHAGDGSGDLLYTADTGPAADLVGFGQGCSVVLAEAADTATNSTPREQRGHLTPQEAGQLAADIGARTLVMTHIWEEHGIDDVMRAAGERFSGTLLRAIPGMELRWRS